MIPQRLVSLRWFDQPSPALRRAWLVCPGANQKNKVSAPIGRSLVQCNRWRMILDEGKTTNAVSGWGRSAAISRSREKLESVVKWLAWFDYSDRSTIAAMLGVDADGQRAFFKRLEESGFLLVERAPGIDRKIYSLGEAGFEYALMLAPELNLKRRRRLPSWVSMIHSFSVQAAIITRMPDIETLRPEKTLKHLRTVRLPDAILTMKNGTTVALEVELNHKSSPRVYNIFLSHLKNIRGGHYDKVLYLFPNAGLCSLYQEKYDQPIWPIYRLLPETTRLIQDKDRSFTASPVHESKLMQFQVEVMYTL